jgi:tetratricopeptide (TPR) repeat protein
LDKNKIIEAAAKLVAKGAYDKAIKEYQKILDVDPKDVRILQKMGELYQKKNDNVQAAVYFTKVAESYTSDGFFLKAVALYKQVLKLDPSLMTVNLRLAELHQQLQLLSESMAYYQIVANHYDKSGDAPKSLEVLKKMVDLDPDNVASRVKLADLYVREQMNGEAQAEFQRAAEHLKRSGRIDDYLRVAERISALDPSNLQLARELAELYLQRSDQKKALSKLQVCFKADPRDVETLRLLAVAFQGLGQTAKTISVYKALARALEERGQTTEAEQAWAQVGQLDPNDAELAARRGPARAPTPAPMPMPVAQPRPATGAQSAYQPAQPAAPTRPAPPVAAPARGPDQALAKLLTETDVYVKYGLHDKALEHLRKVFAVDPENIDAHEKAYAIYLASNNNAQAFEQLLNVLRLHTRGGDAQRAQPYLMAMLQQNPAHPEVPAFLAALRVSGPVSATAVAPAHESEQGEDAILVSGDDGVIVDEVHEEPISAEVAVVPEEVLDEPFEPEPAAMEPMLLSADDAAHAEQIEVEPPPVPDGSPDADQVVSDFEADPTTASLMAQAQAQAAADEAALLGADGNDEALLEEPILETPTGEHYLGEDPEEPTQGQGIKVRQPGASAGPATPFDSPAELGDDEHEVATRVMQQVDPTLLKTASGYRSPVAPPEPAVWAPEPAEQSFAEQSFAEQSFAEQSFAEQSFAEQSFAEQSFAEPPPEEQPWASDSSVAAAPEGAAAVYEEPVEAPPEEEPAGEECDEATFFIEQGLFDEAREILETVLIAYPDHRRASELFAQMEAAAAGGAPAAVEPQAEAQAPDGGARDAFDLAAELAGELGEYAQEAAAEPASSGSDDYQVSVAEVFSEFKKGLEKVVKPEDVETHYDLGIAYKEMGLIDDAISEFSVARQGCVGKRKEIECLTMMGLLQVMKGDFVGAVDSYMQGLASDQATGDLEKALRFELGAAYEAAQQPGRALAQFLKVEALDPVYRDVGTLVARLQAIAVPEETPPPVPISAGKKPGGGGPAGAPVSRKVGYL